MELLLPSFTEIYDKITCEKLKNEFKHANNECYVDHAGATLYSDTQIKKIFHDLSSSVYPNPHSSIGPGNVTMEIVERTRYRILDYFNASSDEYSLVFTSGTTASLKCIAESFKFNNTSNTNGYHNESNGNFVYLQDNHTSVLGMRDVVAQKGAEVVCLTCDNAFNIFSQENGAFVSDNSEMSNNSLFVYAAQCNFSGFKNPLNWIDKVHNGYLDKFINDNNHNSNNDYSHNRRNKSKWYVVLDVACYVGTNRLDLSVIKPDFVVMSFYKMFGYSSGIGALIVKNSSTDVLDKIYYGGGTIEMALTLKNYHVKRENFQDRFEDGTLPFLSIISLQHGLDAHSAIPIEKISMHVFSLAQYLHHSLLTMHHHNGNPVAKLYTDSDFQSSELQGGILTFNLLRSSGEYIGYIEVLHMAELFKIHLRTGCLCNPGACQRHLNLSNADVLKNHNSNVKCGGSVDLINGKPTGAVRISFGYMSTIDDVHTILTMIRKCFLNDAEVNKIPRWYQKRRIEWSEKYHTYILMKNLIVSNGNASEEDDLKKTKNCDEKINSTLDNRQDKSLTLLKMFIYPIKSCGAFEVQNSWILTDKGLQYDREWMIITSAGTCLTQKQEVNLCLMKPTICPDDNVLMLDYPGMPRACISLDCTPENNNNSITNSVNGEMCRSRVCGHRVEGIDCGDEISEWLSVALGRSDLKLIRQNNSLNVRNSKPELTFSSQAQYLLINSASISWLVDRIPENSDCDNSNVLHRFRGNLIVDGDLPFEENSWMNIKIGNEYFEVKGPCTRCQMVCIDQNTGLKTVQPLKLLAEEFHGKMKFGIYLMKKNSNFSRISVGDSVHVMNEN